MVFGSTKNHEKDKKTQPFHSLKELEVRGDFNGDHRTETLALHFYSEKNKTEQKIALNPFYYEWDSVIHWFYDQNISSYLCNKLGGDTLSLGVNHGLYCLINVGDCTGDGTDEIGLVIDYLDYSRINSCIIYHLDQQRNWIPIFRFGIHEMAFDFTRKTYPKFNQIPGFLIKKKSKWYYHDYLEIGTDSQEETGKMKPLIFHSSH